MSRVLVAATLLTVLALGACVSVDERRRRTVERAEALLDMGDTGKALAVLDGYAIVVVGVEFEQD